MPTINPKNPKKAKQVLALIVGLAAITGLLYLVGFSHFFDVKSWEIYEDKTKVITDDALNNLLKGEKNKNLVFINETWLINQVKAIHPEFKKIVIEKVFPQKIKVQIEKYPIVANIVDVVQGVQKKFLVDSQGFLADENMENQELPYIKVFNNDVFTVHTTAIEPDKLNYILGAISQFQQEFSMKILNAEYYVIEREVHLQTEKGFMVWIDMQKDFNAQLDKLKKVLTKLDIYHTALEYIDLRIDGVNNQKVIYKPTNTPVTK